MNNEQQEVAELMRSGRYFNEARGWYQALYIGPISERSFFLLVAVLAVLVCFVGILALRGLLPITEHPGLVVRTGDPTMVVPTITRIRSGNESMDVAMERFMSLTYVVSRESYSAEEYARNAAFVHAHSDGPTNQQYDQIYGAANPGSPAAVLGKSGERVVEINGFSLNTSVEPRVATVKFSTALTGVGVNKKTQWTATLGYYYSPMVTTNRVDPSTGETSISVEDPQFKVVNYAVSQTP